MFEQRPKYSLDPALSYECPSGFLEELGRETMCPTTLIWRESHLLRNVILWAGGLNLSRAINHICSKGELNHLGRAISRRSTPSCIQYCAPIGRQPLGREPGRRCTQTTSRVCFPRYLTPPNSLRFGFTIYAIRARPYYSLSECMRSWSKKHLPTRLIN